MRSWLPILVLFVTGACSSPRAATVVHAHASEAIGPVRSNESGRPIRSRFRGRYCWADRGPGLPHAALVKEAGDTLRLDSRWPWTHLGAASLLAGARNGRWLVAATRGAAPNVPWAMMVDTKGQTKWRLELPKDALVGAVAAGDDGRAAIVTVSPDSARAPTLVQVSPYGTVQWTRSVDISRGGIVPVPVAVAAGPDHSCVATESAVMCFDRGGGEYLEEAELGCRTEPALAIHSSGVVAACWRSGAQGGLSLKHATRDGHRWFTRIGQGLMSPSDVIDLNDHLLVLVVAATDGRMRSDECEYGSPLSAGQAVVLSVDSSNGRCMRTQQLGPSTLQEYRFMPSGGHIDLSLVPRETPAWSQVDPNNPFLENGYCKKGSVYEAFSLSIH